MFFFSFHLLGPAQPGRGRGLCPTRLDRGGAVVRPENKLFVDGKDRCTTFRRLANKCYYVAGLCSLRTLADLAKGGDAAARFKTAATQPRDDDRGVRDRRQISDASRQGASLTNCRPRRPASARSEPLAEGLRHVSDTWEKFQSAVVVRRGRSDTATSQHTRAGEKFSGNTHESLWRKPRGVSFTVAGKSRHLSLTSSPRRSAALHSCHCTVTALHSP